MNYDLTQPGTPIDREKLVSIGVLGKRTKDTVVEGKSHPESGLPFKSTTDECNNTVTVHGARGSGVDNRQDVLVRPKTVKGRLFN